MPKYKFYARTIIRSLIHWDSQWEWNFIGWRQVNDCYKSINFPRYYALVCIWVSVAVKVFWHLLEPSLSLKHGSDRLPLELFFLLIRVNSGSLKSTLDYYRSCSFNLFIVAVALTFVWLLSLLRFNSLLSSGILDGIIICLWCSLLLLLLCLFLDILLDWHVFLFIRLNFLFC